MVHSAPAVSGGSEDAAPDRGDIAPGASHWLLIDDALAAGDAPEKR
jgi:hypothetical protein